MRPTILILAATTLSAQALRFDFVSAQPAAGFQKVPPGAMYSEEAGYGFEEPPAPPFYFSVRVPEEGNYRVTVTRRIRTPIP